MARDGAGVIMGSGKIDSCSSSSFVVEMVLQLRIAINEGLVASRSSLLIILLKESVGAEPATGHMILMTLMAMAALRLTSRRSTTMPREESRSGPFL